MYTRVQYSTSTSRIPLLNAVAGLVLLVFALLFFSDMSMIMMIFNPRQLGASPKRVLVPRTRHLPEPENPSHHWPALRQIFHAGAELELSLLQSGSPLDLEWI